MTTRAKMLLLILALTTPAAMCPPITIKGPTTPECPKGEWIVTVDDQGRTGSVVCKEPASPTPVPSPPSPAPSIEPSAQPTPEPRPSPSTTPAPSPSASPSPAPSTSPLPSPGPSAQPAEGLVPCIGFPQFQCPRIGECVASWDHTATRVGIGDKTSDSPQGQRMRYQVFLSSKDQPPYCGQRGNVGECEQWEVCAREQDRKGFPPVVWYAEYPGTGCDVNSINVQDCQIEHPSRLCDPTEQAEDAAQGLPPNACRRPNGFALVDIVGAGGGPVGIRTFAAAPSNYVHGARRAAPYNPAHWIRTPDGGFKRNVSVAPRRGISRAIGATSFRRWNCDLRGCTLLP